jgi:hypothetical protein
MSPLPSRVKVRAFRERRRNGRRCVRAVEISDELPLALVDAGFLEEWSTEDDAEVAKAISRADPLVALANFDVAQIGRLDCGN